MPIQNITGPGYSHATFVVDSIDEVDQVPVKTLATTVLCLEDGQTRVADSQGGWHVFPTTSAPVFDNYTLLNNKPTLNGVTLNGDLTSSDVGVQDKLTAGSNIVISENGTISAVGSGRTVDYSTEEQDTGVKWVDGKTIYQRTFYIDTTTSSQYIGYTISTTPIENMIDFEGFVFFDDNDGVHFYRPISFSDNSSFSTVVKNSSDNTPQLLHKEWFSGYAYNGYVTILYTKTT